MKRKTIIKNIKDKLNNWLSTIKDTKLAKDVKYDLIVSGGCIASMLTNTDINDYDIYFKSKDVLNRLIVYYMDEYYHKDMILLDGELKEKYIEDYKYSIDSPNGYSIAISNLTSDRLKLFSTEGIYRRDILEIKKDNNIEIDKPLGEVYNPIVWTANALSLTNDIQIIIRFHGNPDEIHSNYDFVHATNYFTFNDGLVTNIPALESLMSKTLIYSGSKYPVTSIIRAKKFILRGYNINAGEYLKMMWQISELDLTNLYILEEQLMGVDVAYFNILIRLLREETEKDINFKINTDWLFVIINKIFNNELE